MPKACFASDAQDAHCANVAHGHGSRDANDAHGADEANGANEMTRG